MLLLTQGELKEFLGASVGTGSVDVVCVGLEAAGSVDSVHVAGKRECSGAGPLRGPIVKASPCI